MKTGDRHHSYLANALNHVEAALAGVQHEIFISPPTLTPPWRGLVECQNLIVEKFLGGNYDYLWLVELDVEVPRNAFQLLFSLDCDIACGYVRRHDGGGLILGFLDEAMHVWYLPENAVKGKVLSGWVMAGTSCVLFKRRVFEGGLRFTFREAVTPDILFMYNAQRKGFTAKVHGNVYCGHLPEFPLAEADLNA